MNAALQLGRLLSFDPPSLEVVLVGGVSHGHVCRALVSRDPVARILASLSDIHLLLTG
jgi:hypothetical protein